MKLCNVVMRGTHKHHCPKITFTSGRSFLSSTLLKTIKMINFLPSMSALTIKLTKHYQSTIFSTCVWVLVNLHQQINKSRSSIQWTGIKRDKMLGAFNQIILWKELVLINPSATKAVIKIIHPLETNIKKVSHLLNH